MRHSNFSGERCGHLIYVSQSLTHKIHPTLTNERGLIKRSYLSWVSQLD